MDKDITVWKKFSYKSEKFETHTGVSGCKVVIGQAPLNLLEIAPNLSLYRKDPESLQPSQVAKYFFCVLEGGDNGITKIVFEQLPCDICEVFG